MQRVLSVHVGGADPGLLCAKGGGAPASDPGLRVSPGSLWLSKTVPESCVLDEDGVMKTAV